MLGNIGSIVSPDLHYRGLSYTPRLVSQYELLTYL